MRKLRRIPTGLLFLGIVMAAVPLAAAPALAAPGTLYVSTTGTNTGGNNCQTQSSPCATISYAVSKAASGDTIQLAAGTYHDIVAIASPLTGITIEGPSGGATVDGVSTTAQIGSVFTVENGSSATIENLSIANGEGALFTNGSVSTTYGNGVFVSQGATATLSNDTISGNEDLRGQSFIDDGGAVYNGGTLVMNNDTMSGNGAPAGMFDGGAIFTAAGTSTTLNDDTFSGNVAADAGGAIYNAGTTTLNEPGGVHRAERERRGRCLQRARDRPPPRRYARQERSRERLCRLHESRHHHRHRRDHLRRQRGVRVLHHRGLDLERRRLQPER
jgi:predicted outer membrane repeat protein